MQMDLKHMIMTKIILKSHQGKQRNNKSDKYQTDERFKTLHPRLLEKEGMQPINRTADGV